MTTVALKAKQLQEKAKSLALPSFPWKIMYGFGLIFVVLMLIAYVVLVNQLTQGSYTVRGYNKDITKLVMEGKVLETNYAESGFLGSVQEKVKQLGFEKTTEVTYVEVLDNSLGMVK